MVTLTAVVPVNEVHDAGQGQLPPKRTDEQFGVNQVPQGGCGIEVRRDCRHTSVEQASRMPVSGQKDDEPLGGALRQEGICARAYPIPTAPQRSPLPAIPRDLDQLVDNVLGQGTVGSKCGSQVKVPVQRLLGEFFFGHVAQDLGWSCRV